MKLHYLLPLWVIGVSLAHEHQPKVLSIPTKRQPRNIHGTSLYSRSPIAAGLENALQYGAYGINITVGTPGQLVEVQLDTGSSDFWVHSAKECSQIDCIGNGFNLNDSTTAKMLYKGGFEIEYGTPGSYVTGDYIEETISMSGVTVTNMTMAVANASAHEQFGILGVGFDINESWVTNGRPEPYLNIIDLLVSQGIINTRAYSLYLNDKEASIGQIIFGGYDTEKISGSLYSLPMQPNEATNTISTMTIALTSLGFEKGGQVENLSGDAFPVPVLLDSGTTYLNVPQAVYSTMYSYFEVSQDSSGNHIVDCDLLSNANGSLNFGFGGTDGPLIKVPFSEFALPSNSAVNMTNGNAACQFGMGYSKDDQWILGDTFLRSAYVVYDLDNQIISLAQTNFNSTSTNVIEIGSDVVGTSISQGVTVHETATGVVGGDNHAPTGSVAASATGHFTVSGSIGEATGISATASSSNSPSAASSSATSSADNLTPFSSLKTMLCAVSLVSAVLSLL